MKFGAILIRAEYIHCILFRKELLEYVNKLTMSHTKPIFYQLKTLAVQDMVNFNSMVFMYKVYNSLLPANILLYFQKVNASHNHNICKKNCNFKIRYSRTTKKSDCISVKGPKIWNDLCDDIKLCNSIYQFKKNYKALLLLRYE